MRGGVGSDAVEADLLGGRRGEATTTGEESKTARDLGIIEYDEERGSRTVTEQGFDQS